MTAESGGATPPTLFVSDLHLAPERPAIAERFVRFCAGTARRAAALYILGDLFEFWVGDDTSDEPFNRGICDAIRGVTAAGIPVHFLRGNRDFLVGAGFAGATGATLLPDAALIDVHGTPTLLVHGDTLCTDDHAYQAFRRQVRNPEVQAHFLALPVPVRKQQVGAARAQSEQQKQTKAMDIMDVAPATVEATFREHDCRRMIHGHTHRPADHRHVVDGRSCERIVLADWRDDLAEALVADGRGLRRLPLPLD